MRSILCVVALSVFMTGCSVNRNGGQIEMYLTNPIGVSAELDGELLKVKEEFDKIESKEDKLLIHKMFAGSADYLLACKSLDSTAQFGPLLGKVQSSYGWNRDKYSDFTDAVSDYLVSVDYDEPKKLSSTSDRKEFAKIFQDLAEATKYE